MWRKYIHRNTTSRLAIFTIVVLLSVTPALAQEATAVQWGFSADGIPTLMDGSGFTLYTFADDEGGPSTCYDQCAEAWPPFIAIAADGAAPSGDGLSGTLGTVEREDGSQQVTYNGWPLYYFAQDAAAGDANGQGIRDVWFAANPATVMVRTVDGLGEVLVGPGGQTLYVFLEDEIENGVGESYCYEECAEAWPPLLLPEGTEPSATGGVLGDLGTTVREDGSRQVSFNGWPLYFFRGDSAPGDTTGNAAKNVWYVAFNNAASENAHSIDVQLVAEGLAAPIAMVSANDGSGRMFIADQAGMIRILNADGTLMEEPFLDLTGQITPLDPGYDERGLLGLAFHPDYANNGRIFIYFTIPLRAEAPQDWNHTNLIAEVQVSAEDPNRADLGTLRNILSFDQPQMNHNAGQITFGPDGFLYIPIGDGGGGNDTGTGHTPDIGNAQDTTNLHGSILRIDVNSDLPYAIPADNPFIGEDDGVLDEIWAYGLRNPFHISFDGAGRLFVGDAGQELYEEVAIVEAGSNQGWNVKEGAHCFDPDNPETPPVTCETNDATGMALVDPIIEYDHVSGNVVVGGYLYEGSAVSDLSGYYIFGSYALTGNTPSGLLFAAEPSEDGGMWQMSEIRVGNGEDGRLGQYVLSFAQDDSGELYVLTTERSAPVGNTGKVWKIVAAGSGSEMGGDEMSMEPADTSSIPDTVTVGASYTTGGIPTLVGPDAHTLYTLQKDHEGESVCYGACAMQWPPLLVGEGGVSAADDGVVGVLGTVDRLDGTQQVTYDGWPLYYYFEDSAPGDASGEGAEDVWFAANPAHVMVNQSGDTLVGPRGLTLYIFTEDQETESYCYEECAVHWWPLTVDEGVQPSAGMGVAGLLATSPRADGLQQITYNGAPVYYFFMDTAPGDALGDGAKDVWFKVTP